MPRRGGHGYHGQYNSDHGQGGAWSGGEGRGYRGGGRGRGGRGGRPPGLRGKDIGLYYARKQKDTGRKERSLIAIDAADQRKLEEKVLRHLARMPPLKGEGEAFRKKLRRNREGNLMREEYHMAANEALKEDAEDDIADNWEELDAKQEIKEEPDVVFESSDADDQLASEYRKQQMTKGYTAMFAFRKKLPAFKQRRELLELVNANQVVVVSGETGCGKTTQVPQFILEDALESGRGSRCRIVCTQPRRISAISIAERVAQERDERLCTSVGYQIRLESRLPRESGSILYCTTGVVLQWMRSNPDLIGYSHIILDEIHERDILSDFLITLLKDVLKKRPDLKVILMSATLNAELFSQYYGGCPMINIPGFTYPVEEFYLEDVLEFTGFEIVGKSTNQGGGGAKWHKFTRRGRDQAAEENVYENFIGPYIRDMRARGKYSERTLESLSRPECEQKINHELIATLVHYIHTTKDDGAILVFVPGWDDISKVNKLLTEDRNYSLTGADTQIFPLHSLMPTISQKSIFTRPPRGVRKIVIATNIAETSITIEDVVYVVDSGKIKMSNFDVENNISTLKPEWVSLANAWQRRGRAGRVQPGVCYHLYREMLHEHMMMQILSEHAPSKARETTLEKYVVPEMLRTRLEEVVLQIKILELGRASSFLSRVLEPPSDRSTELALKLLVDIHALDGEEQLTPLGFHLAQLPMDPQTGKMILLAAVFGCLDPVLSVAASLSFKDAFVTPLGKEALVDEKKRELSRGTRSDHLMLANALLDWEDASSAGQSRQFCWEFFLSESTLKMLDNMKRQFAEHLCNLKFLSSNRVRDKSANVNSGNEDLVRAVICGGLYPNVASVRVKRNKHRGGFPIMKTIQERKVEAHPKSVNAKEVDFIHPWVVYHLKMKSTGVYLYDSSEVSPMSLIFFGRDFKIGQEVLGDGTVLETITVDDFVKFNCENRTSIVFKELRGALDELLEFKVSNPGVTNWDTTKREGAILDAIINLLSCHSVGSSVDHLEDDGDF